MKNKYEEALDYIKHDLEYNDFIRYKNGNSVDKYHRETLLGLVNKETPMKLDKIGMNLYGCPKCDSIINNNCLYCYQCGQKIDWSDEE